MKQEFEILILPNSSINEIGNICLFDYGLAIAERRDIGYPTQHLYVVDNNDLENCEWYIDDSNMVRKSVTNDKTYWSSRKDYKRIIASTNIDMLLYNVKNWSNLPKIPILFIEKYIKAFNDGNPITKVELEFTYNCKFDYTSDPKCNIGECDCKLQVKTNQNNEVIVVNDFVKTQNRVYSRDEMEKIVARAMNRAISFKGSDGAYNDMYNKFIKDNL